MALGRILRWLAFALLDGWCWHWRWNVSGWVGVETARAEAKMDRGWGRGWDGPQLKLVLRRIATGAGAEMNRGWDWC